MKATTREEAIELVEAKHPDAYIVDADEIQDPFRGHTGWKVFVWHTERAYGTDPVEHRGVNARHSYEVQLNEEE